jgi:hypothetical protein
MRFMNEREVEDARHRYFDHPVLGPATKTLENLVAWTNRNSDGWCYWPKPCRAAARLQELVEGNGTWEARVNPDERATPEALKAALRPIKAFRTRQGADFVIVEAGA